MNPSPDPAGSRGAAPHAGSRSSRFSIKSILVITAMVAATAFSAGYLWRAAFSTGEGTEIGQFAIIAAAMPTVFLAGASLFFKLLGKLID